MFALLRGLDGKVGGSLYWSEYYGKPDTWDDRTNEMEGAPPAPASQPWSASTPLWCTAAPGGSPQAEPAALLGTTGVGVAHGGRGGEEGQTGAASAGAVAAREGRRAHRVRLGGEFAAHTPASVQQCRQEPRVLFETLALPEGTGDRGRNAGADALDEKDKKDALVGVIGIHFLKEHPGHMIFQVRDGQPCRRTGARPGACVSLDSLYRRLRVAGPRMLRRPDLSFRRAAALVFCKRTKIKGSKDRDSSGGGQRGGRGPESEFAPGPAGAPPPRLAVACQPDSLRGRAPRLDRA